MFTDFYQGLSLVKNLWISEQSFGMVDNFQCSTALPKIKYNCAVLFLKKNVLVIFYASKYFLTNHNCKTLDRTYWYRRKWQNWLNCLNRELWARRSETSCAQAETSGIELCATAVQKDCFVYSEHLKDIRKMLKSVCRSR